TNQRLGRLPLCIGMPVMFTQNFDVAHGIVNGTIGTIQGIRYTLDARGNRHASSCTIHVPSMTGPPLPHLPEHVAVAIEDSVDM
ncbi:hypothetical protein GGG16DRAFT_25830, partial [Schizophyllum commune]